MNDKEFRLQRHLKKWEEQSKSVKRFIIAGLLFSVLLPIKVLNPYVNISEDTTQVEQSIAFLQQEQQKTAELKQNLVQVQEVLTEVQKTIMDEPWMKEKDRLIHTLSDIRERSPRGGSREEYQAAADNTIRTISAQVREMILQPLEGFVQQNKLTRDAMPKLSEGIDRLRLEMERWEEGHVGKRWYNTFFAKDREMRELTYSLGYMLTDISDITRSALSNATSKQETLTLDMVRFDQEIKDREKERDGLNEEMQKLLPEWLRGILSIEQMIQLFPIIVMGLVACITAMSLMLTHHFERAAVIMGLEKEQRMDPVSSSIWTLTYRRLYGTMVTTLTYLLFTVVMWYFFEWGLALLETWLAHSGDGEWISYPVGAHTIRWIGRLVFLSAVLLVILTPTYKVVMLRRENSGTRLGF